MTDNENGINLIKLNHEFVPDGSRVITRYFYPGNNHERAARIMERICSLAEKKVEELLSDTLTLFSIRHRNIKKVFYEHYETASVSAGIKKNLTENKKLLIGAYFTMEYSVASAALFNPSIVAHPDQRDLEDGDLRFIQSFRAVGEGHISSILFGEGVLKQNGTMSIKKKSLFLDKGEISHISNAAYDMEFNDDSEISSRIIFPVVDNERMGIEDARFVRFVDKSPVNNEKYTYYATYTAYNGTEIFPKLIETVNFKKFRISLLRGEGAQNKGMALFPEKINGQYAMISRQDNENLFIMYSDDIYRWRNPQQLRTPEAPWEFVQIGNCGSPIKTDHGWLLLTHGVGAVRRYCMGAVLLDYDDPSRVTAYLAMPFLWPDERERNGYVPNVVYSSGGIIHRGKLIVPYAVSDTSSKIAILPLDKLIGGMVKN